MLMSVPTIVFWHTTGPNGLQRKLTRETRLLIGSKAMADIIPLPKSYNVRISYQRRARKQACPVIPLAPKPTSETAYELYCRASAIDETEPAKAIPIYEQAIKLDPRLSIAYTNLGNCHFRLYRAEKAEDLYRQAL